MPLFAAPPKGAKEAAKPAVNPAQKAAETLRAIEEYRFNDALNLADQYAKVFNAGAADTLPSPDDLRTRALMGINMLDRVQEVEILERYIVDVTAVAPFLNQKLGSTLFLDDITFRELGIPLPPESDNVQNSAYLYPNGRTVLWDDSEGEGAALMVSRELSDGRWDAPEQFVTLKSLFPDEQVGSTITTPFVMQDGVTLYFGADGPQSLGGLDIFMTRCDPVSGEFLRPLNMGMPFNSPANDFLLAVDEANGEGWWVTDRGMAERPDSVAIFRYKLPGETRINHPADDPDLLAVARGDLPEEQTRIVDMEDVEITLPFPHEDPELSKAIVLPDGRRIESEDLEETTVAKTAVRRWRETLDSFNERQREVEALRRQYVTDKDVADRLLKAEQGLENERRALRQARNAAIRAIQ